MTGRISGISSVCDFTFCSYYEDAAVFFSLSLWKLTTCCSQRDK